MSKIPSDDLREAIVKVLADKEKRKFVQTVDMQIKLKNYDPAKDKRFNGSLKLPQYVKKNLKVCILGDHNHCEKAKEMNIPFRTVDDLKNMGKNKKAVKKLAATYDAFLASDSLIKKIPRLIGPGLSKAGKFPLVLGQNDDIKSKIEEMKKTVKFQLKKEINLGTAIGNVEMAPEEIQQNVTMGLNFLVSLLKKNWQNVGSVHIKATMGSPQKVYP
ncbi:hypothetical protein ABK040_008670 [Willaertia magna]